MDCEETPEVRPFWSWRRDASDVGGRSAKLRVRLQPDSGAMEVDAVLEVGCHLPGNDGASGTIEGVRLDVRGVLNFNQAIQPRATLFINLGAGKDEEDD